MNKSINKTELIHIRIEPDVKIQSETIFKRLGINIIPTVSDNGVIGGSVAEEFQAITNLGEDKLLFDKENNRIVTAMLNEMDGFKSGEGIIVIGATNSFNSLDPALIRPGRFDLKYNISNPDQNTRIKLIELYTKNKKIYKRL